MSRRGGTSKRPPWGATVLAGTLVAGIVSVPDVLPAAASAHGYYAYALGAARAPTTCPRTQVASRRCSLAQAIRLVRGGSEVLLATPGSSARYYGNFSVTKRGGGSGRITIAPAAGVRQPILDGDASRRVSCPTTRCTGPVLTVAQGVVVHLRSLVITDSDATGRGGGVNDLGRLLLSAVTVSDSDALDGGGVAVENGAVLLVSDSRFTGDDARAFGGAIANGDRGKGRAVVVGSTFSGDTAKTAGGAIDNGVRGGTGTAVVRTSTFSHDSAPDGGAIANGVGTGTGVLGVSTSTLTGDSASETGSALSNGAGRSSHATATVLNTTIDANSGDALSNVGSDLLQVGASIVAKSTTANCGGAVSDLGYNLEDDPGSSCGFSSSESDLVGVAPDLGPLGEHGGPAETMVPLSSSPVLNAIPRPAEVVVQPSGTMLRVCPTADQDGNASESLACSIGSVDPPNDVPVVRSVDPRFGPASGGATVTIRGGNFESGVLVTFGSAPATAVNVVSPSEITVTAPEYAGVDDAGTVGVTVTEPSGEASHAAPDDLYGYYSSDWSSYLDGVGHSSFNPAATAISPTDLPRLGQLWGWTAPPSPDGGRFDDFASPIVSDGVIYVGLGDGEFYALDEATRHVLWSRFLGFVPHLTCPGREGVSATATVADDPATGEATVYVNAPDGYLVALDAATGAVKWRSVVGVPSTTENDYYAWSSPAVANGTVYVGISSQCDRPLVPAGVLSFDQSSGKRLAVWHSEPAGDIGASVWSSVAVLPDGDVVATTGNSEGNVQIPYGESIVLLSGGSLKLLSSWMVPRSERVVDGDFGGSPTIFTAAPDGVTTTMVGACNKDGRYYAFRADDLAAGPVWWFGMGEGASDTTGPGCDAAAVWNGRDLIEGGGTPTTIDGTTYEGSVRALDPTTGRVIWQTGLPGFVVGSCSEDGGGVVAAPIWASSSGDTGIYLLSASSGKVIGHLAVGADFAQPVWEGSDLLVGDLSSRPIAAYGLLEGAHASQVARHRR